MAEAKPGPAATTRVVKAAALLCEWINAAGGDWHEPEQEKAYDLLVQQLRDLQSLIQENHG